ncbi:MAG: hypothetical protein BAJATHORv1_10047 [Candidatus Thorarchaeota archaeon]|nr:MAG: hypothetical protein BAJATHORv1_10047 [Candidatus Thorarchaeota archaeon]
MPSAVFLIHLDENHGFILKKRHPISLKVTEADLNNIYVPHAEKAGLHVIELDDTQILSYSKNKMPEWVVCFEMEADDDISFESSRLEGTARLLLELAETSIDDIDLEEIMKSGSSLSEESAEQKFAGVFLTPSAPLILEHLQSAEISGFVSSAALSMWLKKQVGGEGTNVAEAIRPLITSGLVKMEMLTKTKQFVFLVKDVFGHRASPNDSLKLAEMTRPDIYEEYKEQVENFFGADSSGRGYNPTIMEEEEMQTMIEDREKVAVNVANIIHYNVITALRKGPMTLDEIIIQTAFPKSIVQKALWALKSNSIVTSFEEESIWALLTDPVFESFMPKYVLEGISKKWNTKEADSAEVQMYLDLLINTWRTTS